LHELSRVMYKLIEDGYEVLLYPHTLRNPYSRQMISDEDAIK